MNISDAERDRVTKFVRAGGGLIVAGLGWGWQQLNPKQELVTDMGLNRMLEPAGLIWADGTADRTSASGYTADSKPSVLLNASYALDTALSHSAGQTSLDGSALEQASATLALAAASLPSNDKWLLPKLQTLASDPGVNLIPTREHPIRASDLVARVILPLELREMKSLPPGAVKANPASLYFPGSVPKSAPRLNSSRINVQTSIPDWHSTGLYAPPGEVITVLVSPEAANKGLGIRIGAHTDRNWRLKSWTRFPEISREFPLAATTNKVASAFGGLIYITVPRRSRLGETIVEISGAVAAPYFIAGQTDLKGWQNSIRHNPAPWAELASDRVILTLPSATIRTLDDPEALMQVWDKVLDLDAELSGRPMRRERPERVVTDEQISAGYMHSGYPIMTWMDQTNSFASRDSLMNGNWGIFHELGHNHQSGDWTFDGTVEVTCNLFTLHVYDKLCGVPPNVHPRVPAVPASDFYGDIRLRSHLSRSGRAIHFWP